jgi:type VI secretion system protein ImpA
MMGIDVAALLAPVSAEAPAGPAIEYEHDYIELERLSRGVSRQEDAQGKVIREAEEPNWLEVERIALALCAKSKDLRVAIYLARARLALEGLPGFSEALKLIGGYLSEFWPSVHPQLDPADGNDPTIRINTLLALCHAETVLRALRAAPLTRSRQFGRLSYRDYAIAIGQMSAPTVPDGDGRPRDLGAVEAAFADTPIEALNEVQQAAEASLASLAGIDAALSDALGAGNGPDFAPLSKLLADIGVLVEREQAKRGGVGTGVVEPAAGEEGATMEETGQAAARGRAALGVVRSRDDVLLLLDKICRYYTDYEPSSPVPLILNRTKRLVTMNFLDILKELTPGGVHEFGVVAGIKQEE